ncbi:MAG TPA: ATP synthase F1 subunit delta [Spirochaetia bacterium]|nr:MAG: ATP synthase F1 subunit delta [Spirochaetes bacterium GWB1_36_13]HCL57204.1 ATP synthase F1 subunit delta [Spirochaetia bacterium]
MKKLLDNYSKALLEIAVEENSLSEILSTAEAFIEKIFDEENTFFFSLSRSEQKEIIQKSNLPFVFESLILEILNNGRIAFLKQILEDFIEKAFSSLGKESAELILSKEENPLWIQEIIGLFSKRLNKELKVKIKIDPEIIGGFVFYHKGYEYNLSISHYLRKLSEQVYEYTS